MSQDAASLKRTLSLAPVVPVTILNDVSAARPMAEAVTAGDFDKIEKLARDDAALVG